MANTKKTTGKRRGPKPKKTEYYVDPRDLKAELVSFYETEKCTHHLADMIHKIAHGLSYSCDIIICHMTLFKTTIWQTLALYTNTSSRKDTKDTFSVVVFILFFISFAIHIHGGTLELF